MENHESYRAILNELASIGMLAIKINKLSGNNLIKSFALRQFERIKRCEQLLKEQNKGSNNDPQSQT
jgi:hypothetical protein